MKGEDDRLQAYCTMDNTLKFKCILVITTLLTTRSSISINIQLQHLCVAS